MARIITIQLEKPIASADILGSYPTGGRQGSNGRSSAINATGSNPTQQPNAHKTDLNELCQALNGVIAKLNKFYDELLAKHKEQIAKLSVEIARKILVQKVRQGDYQIESIVQEALKNAPTREQMVVHLNPEDLARLQQLQQENPAEALSGIKLVADQKIGLAECLLETPKGIIESFIDKNLEQVGKALETAE